jgi:transposase
VSGLEGLSRDELIALVGEQAERIAVQAERIAELMAANEVLGGRVARLEHLLSRNSSNSSSPPSKDDEPGRILPKAKRRRGGGVDRSKGKQKGRAGLAPGVE